MNGNGYAKVTVKVEYDDNMTGNKNLMESAMLLGIVSRYENLTVVLNSQSRDLSHETALRHESYHYTTSYLANIEIPLQEMCLNLYVHIKNK